ncbi:MAG: YbjN domain-containing protein [Parachlamydiales bacterium]|nr:YbjN domain-containing protein [Parachlamydiales bacterium]
MQIKLSLFQISKILKEKGYLPTIDEDNQQFFIIHKIDEMELPLFFKVASSFQHIQVIAYLPIKVDPEVYNDVARLLHQINCEIDVPGFGLEEKEGMIMFRIFVPCQNGYCTSEFVLSFIDVIHRAFESYKNLILAVVEKETTLDEILAKA